MILNAYYVSIHLQQPGMVLFLVVMQSFPAVYSIRGTKKGDWYLPSVGELKEMYNKISIINPIRKQLVNEEYKMQGYYWTSYEYNADNESAILFTNGSITYTDKKFSKRVIPFLSVSI